MGGFFVSIHLPHNLSSQMNSTVVQCECTSKKESKSHNTAHPVSTQIELTVPYDQSNIFYQLSGGTAITLNTINQDAANMFVIGNTYEIVISPVTK